MNSSAQAKKGFKTFLVALILSLGVFGIFYYFTAYPTDVNIEDHSSRKDEVLSYNARQDTAFEKLSKEKIAVPPKVVLAGADEIPQTTETTVPETGMAGITTGIVISGALLAVLGYIIYLGPRNFALLRFEKDL